MREALDRVGVPTRAEGAVVAAGTAGMGLEILAGRLIAPWFGSSIYTWGSIIGVFLAALALGYHRGGKRAERGAGYARLAGVMLSAAAYVAVVVFAHDDLLALSAAVPVPGRFAPLVPVTLLFGPPIYLLGFVSPYAAQLSEHEGTGEAAGRVYALGTAGSIVGAFAATFLLVPALDVEIVGFLFGALLVAAAAWTARPVGTGRTGRRVLLVAVLLVGATAGGAAGWTATGDVVYRTQTPYQELRVVDSGPERTLYLGGARHSAMDREDPTRHVFAYTRYFHLPLLMTDDVDRVLFVGGGGFTGPRLFAAMYDVHVDVVEIDPVVVRVAREYFDVEEGPDLEIHVADGREYLRETDETYDVIVLDAYRKDKVPFHLTTVEFMALASDRLAPDGVLLANVISAPRGPGSAFFRAEYKTMTRVFPQVYAFPTSDSGLVQNIELVATKDATRLSEAELLERNRARDVGIDLAPEIASYRTDVPTDDVPVLRDDRAPVSQLLDPMLGRKYVIEEGSNRTATAPGREGRAGG